MANPIAIAGILNTTINKILDFIQLFYSPDAVTRRLRKKTIQKADQFITIYDIWQATNNAKQIKTLGKKISGLVREYKDIRKRIR
jgi:hypothetical protein